MKLQTVKHQYSGIRVLKISCSMWFTVSVRLTVSSLKCLFLNELLLR